MNLAASLQRLFTATGRSDAPLRDVEAAWAAADAAPDDLPNRAVVLGNLATCCGRCSSAPARTKRWPKRGAR